MKRILWAAVIATASLMTSCSISQHLTTNCHVTQTNVELSKNNFRIVNAVQGSATVTRILGIGGLSKKAIQANAYAEMVQNAHLSGAQALTNITTEIKLYGAPPFYWKTVVTVHGQVIEFTAPGKQVSGCHATTVEEIEPEATPTRQIDPEVETVVPIVRIKSNTIGYTASQDKAISANMEKHPLFTRNKYRNGQGTLTFMDEITSIPQKAFAGCAGLESITIPASVTKIDDSAFASCPDLETIYLQSTTPPVLVNMQFHISRNTKIYVLQASVGLYESADGWKGYKDQIEGYDFTE